MLKGKILKIVLTGFYGAGNSGDEAMLHNFVHKIKQRAPESIIFIGTDRIGTWQYPGIYYMSALDRARLKETDLFIIGGGDLGVGFGWNLLPWAKKFENKCVMISGGINNSWFHFSLDLIICPILNLFDKIYIRDEDSSKRLDKLKIKHQLTTDMAFDLIKNPISFKKLKKHISLCIRETEPKYEEQMLNFAVNVLKKVVTDGFTVSILPFCEEDAIKCEKISQYFNNRVQLVYSQSPEEHKYVIANSNYLISLGRLHSLIYAADEVIPMIGMDYPYFKDYSKMNAWMKYINMNDLYLDFLPDFNDFLKKWRYMRTYATRFQKNLIKHRVSHRKLNDQQFDEIIKLVYDSK